MLKSEFMVDGCRRLAVLSMAAVLAGCSTLQGAPESPAGQKLETVDSVYGGYVQRLFSAPDEAERLAVRDEYITVRLAIIDRNYHAYRQDLYSQRVGGDVAFDMAALGLTATSAASSSLTAKTNLSALATALLGTKASIDKNVYFDRTLPALLSQMDGSRAEARAQLFAGMLLPTTSYSLAEADAQLTIYRDAGSLVGAVKALTNQAAQLDLKAAETLRKRLPTEEDIVRTLRQRGFATTAVAKTAEALTLQKCVRDGSVLPEVRGQLLAWFNAEQPRWAAKQPAGTASRHPKLLSNLFVLPEYQTLRLQALQDPTSRALVEKCNELNR